eukprot:2617688-Pyramimonas_sp.AAC.1
MCACARMFHACCPYVVHIEPLAGVDVDVAVGVDVGVDVGLDVDVDVDVDVGVAVYVDVKKLPNAPPHLRACLFLLRSRRRAACFCCCFTYGVASA